MVFSDGLDYATIAAQEGVSVGAVKTWMFRCKEKAVALAERMHVRR
jgi:DNA-directed RNA polymerase specialized sigma24 family protein